VRAPGSFRLPPRVRRQGWALRRRAPLRGRCRPRGGAVRRDARGLARAWRARPVPVAHATTRFATVIGPWRGGRDLDRPRDPVAMRRELRSPALGIDGPQTHRRTDVPRVRTRASTAARCPGEIDAVDRQDAGPIGPQHRAGTRRLALAPNGRRAVHASLIEAGPVSRTGASPAPRHRAPRTSSEHYHYH